METPASNRALMLSRWDDFLQSLCNLLVSELVPAVQVFDLKNVCCVCDYRSEELLPPDEATAAY